jgi:tetratricopeptide (TPR) repeat protein/predicted MPP superfamily phosphohydrolase
MSKTSLSWLHLSDLHFRAQARQEADSADILEQLLTDIAKTRTRLGSSVDLVLITGDIAFSGKRAEYQLAAEFLSRVAEIAAVPLKQFFMVPGNHDVDRDTIDDATSGVHALIVNKPGSLDGMLAKPESRRARQLLFDKFSEYAGFTAANTALSAISVDQPFFVATDLGLKGRPSISIVGLNSALKSERGNGKDGEESERSLMLGKHQVQKALLLAQSQRSLVIALMHHPLSWLKDEDEVRNYFHERVDVLLTGHMHDARFVQHSGPQRLSIEHAAGSTYADADYRNAYAMTTVVLEEGDHGRPVITAGRIIGRQWMSSALRWAPDPRLSEQGEYSWGDFHNSLHSRRPAAPHPISAGEPASPGQEPVEHERVPAWLLPPSPQSPVRREALNAQLAKLVAENPVIAVEGLSGSGKTTLVAAYLPTAGFSQILWHDATQGESLDGLLAAVSSMLPFSGSTPEAKCKELLHELRSRKICLVVDAYHLSDWPSYRTLLDAAARHHGPAHLVLISRVYVDPLLTTPAIGHLEIGGLSEQELKKLLAHYGLPDLEESVIQSLQSVTGGLPLAAVLFALLITRFGYEPSSLMSGTMLTQERLRSWFDEVTKHLGDEGRLLLASLSLCSFPFNRGLVSTLAKVRGLQKPDQTFDHLQRYYLVQRYSPYRWAVQQLIAMFAQEQLSPEQRRDVHSALGYYFIKGAGTGKTGRTLQKEDFSTVVRACQEFQMAGNWKESGRTLERLSPMAKAQGFLNLFLRLTSRELAENPGRDPWIDYHHAHCCFMLGRLRESLRITESLLYRAKGPATLRIAVVRLYAEVLGSLGRFEEALAQLRGTLAEQRSERVPRNIVSHARSIEVWLLTEQGRPEEARALCQSLLEQSVREGDKRAIAIALMRLGVLQYDAREFQASQASFSKALSGFWDCNDRRGHAWALSRLALLQMRSEEDRQRGQANLKMALQHRRECGDCHVDYYRMLTEAQELVRGSEVEPLLLQEIERVRFALSG